MNHVRVHLGIQMENGKPLDATIIEAAVGAAERVLLGNMTVRSVESAYEVISPGEPYADELQSHGDVDADGDVRAAL